MSDVKRWLDATGELRDEELRVLRAGSAVEPPRGVVDEVWSGLVLHLAAPLSGGVSAGSADAVATSGAGAAATSVGGTGAAVAGAGGLELAANGALGAAQGMTMSATFAQMVAAPLALGALAGTLLMGGAMLVGESGPATAPAPLASAQPRSGLERFPRRVEPTAAEAPRGITQTPLDDEPRSLRTVSPSHPRAGDTRGKAQQQEAIAPGVRARPEGPGQAHTLPSSRAEFPPVAELGTGEQGSARSSGGQAQPVNAQQRHAAAQAESRVIAQAREALRAGQVPAALSTLERSRSLFPDGILRQEREALTIEALVRSGQRGRARTRAAAFLEAYPRSPHADQVRRVVGVE